MSSLSRVELLFVESYTLENETNGEAHDQQNTFGQLWAWTLIAGTVARELPYGVLYRSP